MATNQYGQTEWDADPETAAELRRLSNQEKVAAAMAAKGQVPLTGQMVGNTYVGASPLQGLANMFHQYNAGQATKSAEEGYRALGDRKAQEYASAIADYKRNTMGTPGVPEQALFTDDYTAVPKEDQVKAAVPAMVPTADQRRQAIIEAAVSTNPRLSKMGQMDFQMDSQKEAKQDAIKARMDELQFRLSEGRITKQEADARAADLRREMQEAGFAQQRSMAQLAAGLRQPRDEGAPVAVVGPDGKPVFVSRKDAAGKTPASMDATTQGALSGAKEEGQIKAKRAINMAGLGDTIDTAEKLLTGTGGQALPTGSASGTLYDTVAGWVGASPEGAKEAQTMKAIGGALTSKMPRMEGPQSDKDVQLYKEMAAVVGDSTVPRDRRTAALQVVKDLWGKYESVGQNSSQAPKKIASDADYASLPSGAIFIDPQGNQRRKP